MLPLNHRPNTNTPPPPPPRRFSRIRPRSPRQAARVKAYKTILRRWLANKECAICRAAHKHRPATAVHHIRGRIASLLSNTKFWLPVCNYHARWVHQHPKIAQQRGWLAPPGQWNNPRD